jgi:hypothetical protein
MQIEPTSASLYPTEDTGFPYLVRVQLRPTSESLGALIPLDPLVPISAVRGEVTDLGAQKTGTPHWHYSPTFQIDGMRVIHLLGDFPRNRGVRQESGDILFLSGCCEVCFGIASYHENSLELSQRCFLHRADSPAHDSLAIPLVQVGDALVVTCKPPLKRTRGRRKPHVRFRLESGTACYLELMRMNKRLTSD